MSFWDALLGRAKTPKPVTDPLFALSTAWVTFQETAGYIPAGTAGIVIKSAASEHFCQTKNEIDELLTLTAAEFGSQVQSQTDNYGYLWLTARDSDWEDLVALIHMAGSTLTEQGYGEQLLAAVFHLKKEQGDKTLYLIYGYKRGKFYPFIPRPGEGQKRDESEEMRLFALLERELPWETDTSRWYPLWDCPV